MNTPNKIWADCKNCSFSSLEDGNLYCKRFQMTKLPTLSANNSICSNYKANIKNVSVPQLSNLEFGVLYFYDPEHPNKFIEDIDLL